MSASADTPRSEPPWPTSRSTVLIRDQRDAVLVLRLNRPEARNAFNPPLMGELGAALAEAERDPEVGAVVITGTGDRSFCAGMDLRAFSEGSGAAPDWFRGGSGDLQPLPRR